MELPVQHNGKKYLFGNQSPLLPVFLLHHKAPGAFGDPRWLPVPLASFPGERRGEGARWDCGARAWGMELLLLPLRSLALDGVPAAFLPLTVKPSEAERLSARFKESFSILILFFPGVLTDLWTTQHPIFTVLQCQTPQSVCIAGFYSCKIKSMGQWELEMLLWRQRGSSEGKGDAATLLFSDLLYHFLKRTNNNHHP